MVELRHSLDELVDLVLAVAEVAALDEVVRLLGPSAHRVAQLERPEEVGRLLEVLADRRDLVDEVLRADDVVLAWNSSKSVRLSWKLRERPSFPYQGSPRRWSCR